MPSECLKFYDLVFGQSQFNEIRNVERCKFCKFIFVNVEFSECFPSFLYIESFPIFDAIFLQTKRHQIGKRRY